MESEEKKKGFSLKAKTDRMDERAPSPIPLTPPSSPMSERREARPSNYFTEKMKDKAMGTELSSPINIPCSKAKTMITPGLEVTSLTSLSHVPTSKFIVGRSHYTLQPITIEYYVTDRLVDPEPQKGEGVVIGPKVLKQSTTIRSIGDYQIIRTVGSGSTGKVKLGVNIRTQRKVAIKIISRKYINDSGKKSKETPSSRKRRILREAAILNLVHHPNIVRLYDLYITEEYYCMVFEYIDGGQMLDYIINHGKMKEAQAQKFFIQLLSAVSYCHDNAIVHRDLKIENVLIDTNGDVKLVDFGLSNFFDPSEKLKTFCGSLYFAAPELLRGIVYNGPEIDVWSLGIILYVLVCGKVPFDDKSMSALHDKIKSGQFVLPPYISRGCQNLLKSMIEVDPKRRARINEIIKHPWVQSEGHVVPNFFQGRSQFSQINPDIERFLMREFSYQFEEEEIKRVLKASLLEWNQFSRHPIVSLYFLSLQKHERQLNDPFSASPQIPVAKNFNVPIVQTAKVESELISIIPHSLDYTSLTRKRTESLPGPGNNASKTMKSKRSSSIQGGPQEIREKKKFERNREEEEEIENGMFPIDETEEDLIKVRTVYLRGIFSVNTTSTRSAKEIRQIIMKCLTERHENIIFLDRESYFICEYQSTSVQIEEDDYDDSCTLDDIDISQIDLAEDDNNFESPVSLTFGAAPLRSIRFEIHIVKVALLGMNGIQFKRISGDFSVYKNLCSQLISEFSL